MNNHIYNVGQPCFMVLIPYNSSMSLSESRLESYLLGNSPTDYTDSFYISLTARILETWSTFESSAIVPTIIGVHQAVYRPNAPGPADNVLVSIPVGGLVCPKQFVNIPDMELPSNHYQRTDHMQHMLDSLDRAFLLTMLRWWGEYKLPPKLITVGDQTQHWISSPPVILPGFVTTTLEEGVLKLGDGESLGDGFAQAFIDNFFTANISLFPDMTEYLLGFVTNIADSMKLAVDDWMDDTSIYGGVVAGIISPPGLFVPTIAAQKLST
jgi:hypothetical protein